MVGRVTMLDKMMNEVILYGGFPMRRGDVISHLDKVAKSTGEKNWLRIRDAGLLGVEQYNDMHPIAPNAEYLTLAEFEQITEAPSGTLVPPELHRKWVTAFQPSANYDVVRVRAPAPTGRKRSGGSRSAPRRKRVSDTPLMGRIRG